MLDALLQSSGQFAIFLSGTLVYRAFLETESPAMVAGRLFTVYELSLTTCHCRGT